MVCVCLCVCGGIDPGAELHVLQSQHEELNSIHQYQQTEVSGWCGGCGWVSD